MIREVNEGDLEDMRQARNKWYQLGIFRQSKEITKDEQQFWYKTTDNPGWIINDRAYGKIYDNGEIAFYGYDVWEVEDLIELIETEGKGKNPEPTHRGGLGVLGSNPAPGQRQDPLCRGPG